MKKNRNISRIIAVLLVLAMMLSNVSMMVFSADSPCAEDGCSGTYRNGICSASGHYEAAPIEEDVYRISNAGQLYWFAALVNAGANEFGGDNGEVYNAVLTADIILNADMSAEDKLAWTPIGLYTSGREYVRYSGTFDGNGKTICGLYYDNTNYDGRNAGLFGTVDSNGVVKNLTLADSVINGATEIGGIASYNYGDVTGCTNASPVTGTGATGGIVCRNLGVVENCVNTGAVSGSTTGDIAAENNGEVVSCENSGVINGTNSVGGIVGMNDGSVEDSLNTANVTASGTHVGGVVGNLVGGGIAGSGNTGNVTGASDYIGGVAGVCSAASITESYNTGAVIGNTGKSEAVGGVVGAIDGTNLTASSITSCYNTGAVSGRSWVGGIAGISGYQKTPQAVTFSNGYSTGAVSGSSNTGAVVGKLSKGTVSGIYYLQGAQNSVSGATAATAEQFASGEIAFELNTVSNVWFQALDIEGIEPDASPVLDETHGVVREGYANCTELGYTNRENYNEPGDHVDEDWDQVCDKCGATLGEPHEHDFSDWTRTKEPTCSEYGEETRICSICNYPQKRQVEKLPHTEEIIPGVPATFDETGLTEGKRCTVCGEITVAQTTAPVLDYNEGIVPLEVLNVSCGDWQTGYETTEGPANLAVDNNLDTIWHTNWYGTSNENHWFQFEITEDYTVDGLRYKPRVQGNTNGTITQYEIQVSDDGETFTTIASGDWENNRNWKVVEFEDQNVKYVRLVSVEAYCDNAAYVVASAAEIRLTGEKAEAPHEHTPAEAVRENVNEATCTDAGSYDSVVYCSDCGEEISRETVTVDALGHDFVDGKCTRCDEVQEQPVTNPFVDVPEGSYYYEPVLWAVENEITKGVDDTHFAPDAVSTRGHVVTFLWRAAGSPEPETTENPFVDVKESDYFYKAVLWAYKNEITKGVDDTHFAPTLDCTRAQVVTFLWRAKGSPDSSAETTFTDVEADKYYTTAVAWAVENGITDGMGDDTFGVNVTCNRAYAVTFLYRAFAE